MTGWDSMRTGDMIEGLYAGPKEARYLAEMFDAVMTGRVDTWDVPWFYSCLLNHGLTITPAVNLVTNIGVAGTHTRAKPSHSHFLPCAPLPAIDIQRRQRVYPDVVYERLLHETVLKRPFHFRILKRLKLLGLAVFIRRYLRTIAWMR